MNLLVLFRFSFVRVLTHTGHHVAAVLEAHIHWLHTITIRQTAHSDAKRPLFPIQSGHRFRFNPATDSDAKRPVRLGVLLTLPE